MDIFEVIKKRRSLRKFTEEPVAKELLERIIEAATYAPSACNNQAWKFIVITEQKIKEKIVEQGGSILIKNAPTGILILYDNRTKNFEYHDDIQSAAAAIENLLLTATALQLGACWICHLPPKNKLKKILNIPNCYSPIAYVLIGYPLTATKEMRRKYNLDEIMAYNKFPASWPVAKRNPLIFFLKKAMLKMYFLLPGWLKKGFINRFLDKYFVKKFDN